MPLGESTVWDTFAASSGIAIAVVAALVALWQGNLLRRQVRQSDDISRAQLYQDITRSFIEYDRFFVEHPELRPFFYDNAEIPADPVPRARALATAEMVADLAESCIACRQFSRFSQQIGMTTSPISTRGVLFCESIGANTDSIIPPLCTMLS